LIPSAAISLADERTPAMTTAAVSAPEFDFTPFLPTARPANDRAATPAQAPAARGVLARHGLDWTVSTEALRTASGRPVPGRVAVVRADTGAVIGDVGEDFGPVQNVAAFGHLDALAARGEVGFESAGCLDGGGRVYVRVGVRRARAEVVPGDTVALGIYVFNAHNGSGAFWGVAEDTRLICRNGMVRREAQRLFRLRHSRRVAERVPLAQAELERAVEAFGARVEQYRALARRQLLAREIVEYLGRIVPDPTDPEAKRARANAERTRDEILRLLEEGRGVHELPAIRGTAWHVLNAATEHAQHVRTAGYDAERAFQSNVLGTAAEFKARALETILTYL
jgi:phage/plasmid-like protein (TIGR03299 family)